MMNSSHATSEESQKKIEKTKKQQTEYQSPTNELVREHIRSAGLNHVLPSDSNLPAQRLVKEEDEEKNNSVQLKSFENTEGHQKISEHNTSSITNLPGNLRTGIESLSGIDMSNVQVHKNSSKPADVGAHAYTQGTNIHVAPGQERHLPHEAWHVVQQTQGRVKATTEIGGTPVNDNSELEKEADEAGNRALQEGNIQSTKESSGNSPEKNDIQNSNTPIQRALTTYEDVEAASKGGKFSWADFRTKPDDANTANSASAEGLGTESTENTNLKTDIHWDAVDSNAKEGTKMTANVLGPDHKLGSEPQSGAGKIWNERRNKLSQEAGKKYIAGHLLNNNLGGPGDDPRNLTAIPATVNTTQSSNIEEEVKDYVNNKHNFAFYEVKVDYSKDNAGNKYWYASKLTSSWSLLDKDKNKISNQKEAVIDIPSPSSLKGGQTLAYDDNKKVIDSTNAAKAKINYEKDLVLNDQGYIRIAYTVQKNFAPLIDNLRGKLKLAGLKEVKSEAEKVLLKQEISVLEADLLKVNNLLSETNKELSLKTERLKLEEDKNVDLLSQIKNMTTQLDESEREIGDLLLENEELNAQIDSLKFQLEQTQDELLIEQVGRAAALDTLELQQNPPPPDFEFAQVLDATQDFLNRLKENRDF